jgi:hypothetical protein
MEQVEKSAERHGYLLSEIAVGASLVRAARREKAKP